MPELLQEYWMLVLAALLIGIVVAWWVFHASRRTKVELEDKPEEGAAKRNQALIDAPPAATAPGPLSAAANSDRVAAAPAIADAEAGAAVPAREAIHKMADVAPKQPAETEAAPTPTKAATSGGTSSDDLRRIKGVGPKLVSILAEHGVTSFAQIAAWDDADIDRIDAELGRFQGRIRRDDWVAQARLLQADDISGYEERFGKV